MKDDEDNRLREIYQQLRDGSQDEVSKGNRLWEALNQEGRNNPGPFNPTSFLMIKSFPEDVGDRTQPLSAELDGVSPSISISEGLEGNELKSLTSVYQHLDSGLPVTVRITVHNLGGLDVPSAKVLFFSSGSFIVSESHDSHAVEQRSKDIPMLTSVHVGARASNVAIFDNVSIIPGILRHPKHSMNIVELWLFAKVYSLSPRDYASRDESDIREFRPFKYRHDAKLILT